MSLNIIEYAFSYFFNGTLINQEEYKTFVSNASVYYLIIYYFTLLLLLLFNNCTMYCFKYKDNDIQMIFIHQDRLIW